MYSTDTLGYMYSCVNLWFLGGLNTGNLYQNVKPFTNKLKSSAQKLTVHFGFLPGLLELEEPTTFLFDGNDIFVHLKLVWGPLQTVQVWLNLQIRELHCFPIVVIVTLICTKGLTFPIMTLKYVKRLKTHRSYFQAQYSYYSHNRRDVSLFFLYDSSFILHAWSPWSL